MNLPSNAPPSRPRLNRDRLYARCRRRRSSLYYVTGYYDRAIDDLKVLLRFYRKTTAPAYPVLADLLISLADYIVRGKAQYSKARRIINRVTRTVIVRDHPEIYARICESRGLICFYQARYARALIHYRRALRWHMKLRNKFDTCKTTGTIGLLHKIRGDHRVALAYNKRYLTLAGKLGRKDLICSACGFIGSLYRVLGRIALSLHYLNRNLALSQELGDRDELQSCLNNLGNTCYSAGDLESALRYYRRSLPLALKKGQKRGLAILYENLSLAYWERGEIRNARRYIRKTITLSRSMDNKFILGRAYLHLGIIASADANKIAAADYLRKARWILTVSGNRIDICEICIADAELSFTRGKYRRAGTWAQKARRIARSSRAIDSEIAALRILGKALHARILRSSRALPAREHDHGLRRAVSYLKKSIALARRQGMKLEMAKSYFELAGIYASASGIDVRKAAAYASEAEKIFRETGAKIWLKKTRRLTSVLLRPKQTRRQFHTPRN